MDLKRLEKIEKRVIKGFKNQQMFRSRYVMETSVLNEMKHPTADSKYHQCNLERDVHFRNLISLSFDYREKVADIEILKIELGSLDGPYALKKQIQIERETTTLHFFEKEAHERVREIINWSEIMDILEPQLKYNPDNPEEYQPEKFAIRYRREVEMMEKAGRVNASDLDGAMNILSLDETIKSRR